MMSWGKGIAVGGDCGEEINGGRQGHGDCFDGLLSRAGLSLSLSNTGTHFVHCSHFPCVLFLLSVPE